MSPAELLQRADAVRDAASKRTQISVTELSRSKAWRNELSHAGVIEITDRGNTAAWLVSSEDMRALIEGYVRLQKEAEQAQIDALFASRPDTEPLTGNALRTAAREHLDARLDEISEIAESAYARE